jgi:Family of unknown function (DUF6326)
VGNPAAWPTQWLSRRSANTVIRQRHCTATTSDPAEQKDSRMNTTTDYRDSWINPRFKIAALWTSMLFVFVYVDLFSLYRSDVRADIEAGEIAAFSIGQGFLLGVTVYVALPSLMLFLSLVLPVRVARMANIVLAAVYIPTIVGSAVGEWNYFILGSAIEAALLVGIVYYAWTWPKATHDAATAMRD